MPWPDENPWRRRHRVAPTTPGQHMDHIERRCRAGDISLRQAIEQAYRAGADETEDQAEQAEEE